MEVVTPLCLGALQLTFQPAIFIKIKDIDVPAISFPEEQRVEQSPDLTISPMLTQNICRILNSINMVETKDACHNGFMDSMEG